MSVPEKTMDAGWRMVHEETVYEQYEATVDALMNPALGPDRLVVAGPFEQEVIAKVVAWLHSHRTWEGKADPVAAAFANATAAHFIPSPDRTT